MNISEIFEESPNGFKITSQAPKTPDEAIRYYIFQLDHYTPKDRREIGAGTSRLKIGGSEYPIEYGIIHYSLGKVLMGDTSKGIYTEERAKRIENCLFHFQTAIEFFTVADYPVMFAILCNCIGRLCRERALLISSNRSAYLSKRTSPELTIKYGIDQVLEAFPIYFISKRLVIEHALCSLETGWLFVLQCEFLPNARDTTLREQALTYLDRAISLYQMIVDPEVPGDIIPRDWSIHDPSTYPSYIKIFLEGYELSYIEGCATYLIGRLYHTWDDSKTHEVIFTHQVKAYEHYCKSVKGKKYLPMESPLWADAHHRIATLVFHYPQLIDPDYEESTSMVINPPHPQRRKTFGDSLVTSGNSLIVNSSAQLHIDAAVSHLSVALKCAGLTTPAAMDAYFHLAQAFIYRVQSLIESVPITESVTQTMTLHPDALDWLKKAEANLLEGLARVTAANTQSTHDAYIFYFASLKFAEYKMFERACVPSLTPEDREIFLKDALQHIIDALCSRPLLDNMDLHFIASVQLSQMLLAARRTYAAAKSYGKLLLGLSVMINRCCFLEDTVRTPKRLMDEAYKQVGQAIYSCAKDVKWIKRHYGPLLLHERVTGGYASWSFEDLPSVPMPSHIANSLSSSFVIQRNAMAGATHQVQQDRSAQDMSSKVTMHGSQSSLVNKSPPKGIPPLLLPSSPNKKVMINGEAVLQQIPQSLSGLNAHGMNSFGSAQYLLSHPNHSSSSFINPKPPPGAVPLFAMGHKPDENAPLMSGMGLDSQFPKEKENVSNSNETGNHWFGLFQWTNNNKPNDPKTGQPGNNVVSTKNEREYFYTGPYGRRLRRRIPPMKYMAEIEQKNRKALDRAVKIFLVPLRNPTPGKTFISKDERPTTSNGRSIATTRHSTAQNRSNEDPPSGQTEEKSAKKRSEAKASESESENASHISDSSSSGSESSQSETEETNALPNKKAPRSQPRSSPSKQRKELISKIEKTAKSNVKVRFEQTKKASREKVHRETKVKESNPKDKSNRVGFISKLFTKSLTNKVVPTDELSPSSKQSHGKALMMAAAELRQFQGDEFETESERKMESRESPEKEGSEEQSSKSDGGSSDANSGGSGNSSSSSGDEEEVESFDENEDMFEPSSDLSKKNSKPGVLSWMKPSDPKTTTSQKHSKSQRKERKNSKSDPIRSRRGTNGILQSVMSQFTRGSRVKDKSASGRRSKKEFSLWASSQCFYSFMVLSRLSRMTMVLRTNKLHILDGERAANLLFTKVPSPEIEDLYTVRKVLMKECSKLILSPANLKDLSERPFPELQSLFTSQVKICNLLETFENIIFEKVSKADHFIPIIAVNPVFCRNIILENFDAELLNASNLIDQVSVEGVMAEKNKLKQAAMNVESKLSESEGLSKSLRRQSSTSLKKTSTSGGGSGGGSGGSKLFDDEDVQKEEELVEMAVGKITLTLSQSLDGTGMTTSQHQQLQLKGFKGFHGGARDMLLRHLGNDECMWIWHVPVVGTQLISLVMVWRDNSASAHEYYTYTEAIHSMKNDSKAVNEGSRSTKGTENPKKKKRKLKYKPFPANHKGIVMEFCRCELDMYHLYQLVQNWLDALHSRPAPLRVTRTSDALRSLSCSLSLTELLTIIPPHVRSLVICGPPIIRLIPWSIITLEVPDTSPNAAAAFLDELGSNGLGRNNQPYVRDIHLIERFGVRLGPTLSLFEMCSVSASHLRQTVGLHRMCVIDGEKSFKKETSIDLDTSKLSALGSIGVRATELEVSCVTHVWSADPGECNVLVNELASPLCIQTGLFNAVYNKEKEDEYQQYKCDHQIHRIESINPMKITPKKSSSESQQEREEASQSSKGVSTVHTIRSKTKGKNKESEQKEGSEEEAAPDDDMMEVEVTINPLSRQSKIVEETLQILEKDPKYQFNRKALSLCRVLHVCADKINHPNHSSEKPDGGNVSPKLEATPSEASILLPEFDRVITTAKGEKIRVKDPRNRLDASAVIRQLYIRNCALCVLSRFGVTDDCFDCKPESVDRNFEFIEAMHCAGANTVLYPMWGGSVGGTSTGGGNGLSTLANIVLLIRFYSILPNYSRDRIATVEACRQAQLWLRDATADDIIAFIMKASIPQPRKDIIIEEMESYVTAATLGESKGRDESTLSKASINRSSSSNMIFSVLNRIGSTDPVTGSAVGAPSLQSASGAIDENLESIPHGLNRKGGDKKFFQHILYWGSFNVSGQGGGVHHPDLTEDKDELSEPEPIDTKPLKLTSRAVLKEMEFEVAILRMEGKISEAIELEARLKQLKAKKFQNRIDKARTFGMLIGRGIMDAMDYLDKTFLDQDSDSIEISDDDDNEKKKGKEGEGEETLRLKALRKVDSAAGIDNVKLIVEGHSRDDEDSDEDEDEEEEEGDGEKGERGDYHVTASGVRDVTHSLDDKGKGVEEETTGSEKNPMRKRLKFKPKPLDLTLKSNNNGDIGYSKWKSKVNNLNLSIANKGVIDDVELFKRQELLYRAAAASEASQKRSRGIGLDEVMKEQAGQDRFYDFAMEQSLKRKEELEMKEDSPVKKEVKGKEKKTKKERKAVEEKESKPAEPLPVDKKEVVKLRQEVEQEQEEKEAEDEEDDDDESDEEEGDGEEEPLTGLEKLKDQAKKLQKVWNQIRGEVRSYSQVANIAHHKAEALLSKLPTVPVPKTGSIMKKKTSAKERYEARKRNKMNKQQANQRKWDREERRDGVGKKSHSIRGNDTAVDEKGEEEGSEEKADDESQEEDEEEEEESDEDEEEEEVEEVKEKASSQGMKKVQTNEEYRQSLTDQLRIKRDVQRMNERLK